MYVFPFSLHLFNQLLHPLQAAHELVIARLRSALLLLGMAYSFWKDTIAAGTLAWATRMDFVTLDLALATMGAA